MEVTLSVVANTDDGRALEVNRIARSMFMYCSLYNAGAK